MAFYTLVSYDTVPVPKQNYTLAELGKGVGGGEVVGERDGGWGWVVTGLLFCILVTVYFPSLTSIRSTLDSSFSFLLKSKIKFSSVGSIFASCVEGEDNF